MIISRVSGAGHIRVTLLCASHAPVSDRYRGSAWSKHPPLHGRRQPLCHAQIGGLTVATVITLLLVPVFYSIAVLDLKIIKWEPGKH